MQSSNSIAFSQHLTCGVVREGVIAENFPQISANFPQNFRTLSWRNETHFFANFAEFFPQNFRKLSAKPPSLTTP